MASERERLRRTFDEVPDLYDRARPGYPAGLYDDLISLAGLGEGGCVLEIGCGTGQATRALAERGLDLVCIELGAGLAAVARRNLEQYSRVRVVHGDFETWEPDDADFDAVVAFTAFHWIDPSVRYARSAQLLRDRGSLAVVATQHVTTRGGDPFWNEVQEDYDALVPSPDNRPPPFPEEVTDPVGTEMESSGWFRQIEVRRHLFDVTYNADQYVAVLDTYSSNR